MLISGLTNAVSDVKLFILYIVCMKTLPADEDPLLRRAHAAYLRNTPTADLSYPMSSELRQINNKSYVVLRNAHELLRVYRVRPDGVLRVMRRPPKELT